MTKARVNADNASADIQGVTAGTGLTGGGTSGTVTLTNDMATAIDAKGDLVVGTGADTYDNLAVGNNGDTIVADSSTATGLRYQGSQAAGRNFCINGAMDIWQRGTSSTTNLAYNSADRWFMYQSAGTTTFARESTIIPSYSQYSLKITQASANAVVTVNQAIETANAVQLAGKTVALSFMAAASASTGFVGELYYSTSVDQNVSTGWTQITATTAASATVTSTTFVKISGVWSVPSNAKSLRIVIYLPNLTSGTSAYLGEVQLELGSVTQTFSRAGGTIQGELAACQRYYYLHASGASSLLGSGSYNTGTNANCAVIFPVQMRTTPTLVATSGTSFYQATGGGVDDPFNSVTIFIPSVQAAQLYNNTEVSGTTGHGIIMRTLNAAASVAFNAEL